MYMNSGKERNRLIYFLLHLPLLCIFSPVWRWRWWCCLTDKRYAMAPKFWRWSMMVGTFQYIFDFIVFHQLHTFVRSFSQERPISALYCWWQRCSSNNNNKNISHLFILYQFKLREAECVNCETNGRHRIAKSFFENFRSSQFLFFTFVSVVYQTHFFSTLNYATCDNAICTVYARKLLMWLRFSL